ncbi:MAG: hypothetical protein WA118_05115 [Carboxydocellales bacterium]
MVESLEILVMVVSVILALSVVVVKLASGLTPDRRETLLRTELYCGVWAGAGANWADSSWAGTIWSGSD